MARDLRLGRLATASRRGPRATGKLLGTATSDREATADEVRAHAQALRGLAARSGLEAPQLRDDGTLVVRSSEPGYRVVLEFAGLAAAEVGAYVHVITDDAPAARATGDL